MLKISAKNKKMAIMLGAILFAVILVAAIVRATKAGAKTAGDISKNVFEQLKAMMNFGAVVALLVSAAVYLFTYDYVVTGATYGTLLGTLTTGAAVVSTFNTTYVPKSFFYVAATQLTGVKITVQGDGVIFDSDANGLTHAGVSRLAGQLTNGYTFRISNGFISNKNVIWEFTNSAAQTPAVYVSSDETPVAQGNKPLYLQLIRQQILANSGQDFSDFATLSLPSIAAADNINVLYKDGTQQQLIRNDIQMNLQFIQNIVNTPIYTIDNYGQRVKKVNIIGSAQTAYVQRWVEAGGGMISQTLNG